MFNFFKKKQSINKPVDDDKKILHGHDLSKWTYLGSIRLNVVDNDDKVLYYERILLFVEKGNEVKGKRSYAKSSDVFKYYRFNWFTYDLPLWLTKETPELYMLITEPSQWLKQYMKKEYSAVWSEETKWWKRTEQAKYEVAVEKQKEKETKPDLKVVEFKKPI